MSGLSKRGGARGGSQNGSRPREDREEYSKKPRGKTGRQEMRNVTRTARRPVWEDRTEQAATVDNSSEEENQEDEPEDGDESGMAYGALLTLLKSDHPEKKKRRVKPVQEEVLNEEVAGVVVDEDEDDDDEDIEEDDDIKYGIENDPYEIHFNQPSEEYINEEERLVIKDHGIWPTSSRSKNAEYTSITQLPPGKAIINEHVVNRTKLNQYPVKQRLIEPFERRYPELSEMDHKLLEPMLNYQDVIFPYKTHTNTDYRKLYTLHALNHINKTRDRIMKNNSRLHNHRDSLREGKTIAEIGEEPEIRDQGFTRPKVLILLPTRDAANDLVNELINLSGSEQQENRKRFTTQFHSKEHVPENKPDDFKDHFKGNSNDFFCLGLKFTRKTLKLYTSFYASDLIIASPIGISMILENPDKKKRQDDFLSSIEVLIIDRANQIEMQNWDHINTVLTYVNKIPKEFHDADFSRIRMWLINDQSRLLRQTLMFGEYLTPNINNLVTTKSFNLGGKVKFKPVITSENCIMNSIGVKIKQIYQKFDGGSVPSMDPDMRFKFFTNATLPSLVKSTSYNDGIMIFIPSYYDYLRIKHYMKVSTKLTFGSIDEYTSQSKLTRTRQEFQSGKIKVLLYTERLHFFRRFEISGVKTLLMYSLPSNPLFYKELIRFIGRSVFQEIADLDLVHVKILFSNWDAVSLERIVGSDRAPVMCNSPNELFEFR